MKPIVKNKIVFSNDRKRISWQGDLICEEPLSIRIQDNPYAVVMRTPGDELAHVAGLCFAEGFIDSPEDIAALAFCNGENNNIVNITLSETRHSVVSGRIKGRQFISQTSGKELVEELYRTIEPAKSTLEISAQKAAELINALSEHQPLRKKTRAAHAAAIFDSSFDLLAVAEDVGRHNALDKATGNLFLNRKLVKAGILVLSSRISFELVQKTARAKIPIILAVSRPTSLAVSLADKLDMTLACLSQKNGIDIYCGQQHII